MFAGKSTELLRLVRRQTRAHRRCLVIKYAKDTRYDVLSDQKPKLTTHDCVAIEALPCSLLMPVIGLTTEYDVVAIDEGQFYPDVVEFADLMAHLGKTVLVSALDSDFLRRPFPAVSQLLSRAESYQKLTSICSCGANAPFSLRLTADTSVEVIGGSETYEAACRSCHLRRCVYPDGDGPIVPTPAQLQAHRNRTPSRLILPPASDLSSHSPSPVPEPLEREATPCALSGIAGPSWTDEDAALQPGWPLHPRRLAEVAPPSAQSHTGTKRASPALADPRPAKRLISAVAAAAMQEVE
jgi:thymidine kinase